MTIRICMWSGPRNLSTAMMRSFGSRADTAVWDEPFFAPYLAVTGKDHPGRAETLAAHETDADKVAKFCAQPPATGEPLFFQKHMPHHMIDGFDRDWMRGARHFFLLRDPAAVIASYAKGRADFDISDIGFLQQVALFDDITQWQGSAPPVIESADILDAPEPMLTQLCAALDITFDPAMLSWPAGPQDTDGAWAPHWYKSVEQSTGFAPQKSSSRNVPERYQEMAEQCRAPYERLRAMAIR